MSDTPIPTEPGTREPVPPKRSCLGCGLKGGLGCLAFFVGVLVMGAFLAPKLVLKGVMGFVQKGFDEERAGSLVVGEIEASWSDRQRIRGIQLRDPDGEVVLHVQVDLPGFSDLLDAPEGDDFQLGRIELEVHGALVADESGVTNLDRALALRDPDAGSDGGEVQVSGDSDVGQLLSMLGFDLQVKSKSLRWSDPRTRELGADVELSELDARVLARPHGSWKLTATGSLNSEVGGGLDVDVTAREPDWYDSEWPLGEVEGSVEVRQLSSAIVDGLLAMNGALVESVGPAVDLDLELEEVTPKTGRLELGLTSDHQTLELSGSFADGAFRSEGGKGLALVSDPPQALLKHVLAEHLAPDSTLELAAAKRWTVTARTFRLPFAEGASAAGVAATELSLLCELGDLEYREPGHDPLVLRDVQVVLEQLAGKARARFSAATAEGGSVEFEARPQGLGALVEDGASLDGLAWQADLDVRDLAIGALVARFASEFQHGELFGERANVELDLREGFGRSVLATGELSTDTLAVRIGGLRTGTELLAGEGEVPLRIAGVGSGPTAPLARALSGFMPEDMGLEFRDAPPVIVLEELRIPRTAEGAPDLGRAILRARLDLSDVELRSAGTRVAFSTMDGALDVRPEVPPTFRFDAQILGKPESQVTLDARATEPIALDTVDVQALPPVSFTLTAAGLPTAIVDEFASQDGLLVDVLGPELSLTAASPGLSKDSGDLDARLVSSLGTVEWAGEMKEGVLISRGEEDDLEAQVGLSPLFNQRIIGSLIPFLVDVKKAEGASPVLLRLYDCELPLDADLSKLNGKLRLDLGAVQYQLLPQFEEWLGDRTRVHDTVIKPLDVVIEGGKAKYERLPLPIGDKELVFQGSLDLATRGLSLTGDVPLSVLGSRVSAELTKLRDKGLLSGDLQVPVTVGGTLTRPKLGLKEGTLKELTKDLLPGAVEGLLDRGLKKLLGGND